MVSIAAAILTLGALLPTCALADTNTYFGLQYGVATYEEDRVPELEPEVGIFRIGRHVNRRFDLEVRAGAGLREGKARLLGGASAKVEVDSLFGVYALARLGAPESVSVYGIAGYSRMETTASASLGGFSGSVSHREVGPSFGVGLNYGGFGDFALNLELISYVNGDHFSASIIGLGVLF